MVGSVSPSNQCNNDAGAPHMVDPQLLGILVCPETKQPVREPSAEMLARLNAAIRAGSIRNRAGELVREPLDGALLREDGRVVYPVREDIPIMLVDEAIALHDLP